CRRHRRRLAGGDGRGAHRGPRPGPSGRRGADARPARSSGIGGVRAGDGRRAGARPRRPGRAIGAGGVGQQRLDHGRRGANLRFRRGTRGSRVAAGDRRHGHDGAGTSAGAAGGRDGRRPDSRRRRMKGYRLILEKEVVELWRTYRLAIVCVLFAILGIVVAVEARYLRGITKLFGQIDPELGVGKTGIPDVVDAFVHAIWLFGPIAAVLLTMGAVAGERRGRTAAFVLSKPVGRAGFLWAKFVAVALVLAVATALATLGTWAYSSILFAPQPVLPWLQLWLLGWLAALVFVAITLAASASLASPTGAAAVGLAAFGVISLASTVVTLNPYLPTGLGEVGQALVLTELGSDVDPFRSVAASVALLVVALLLAWLRFRRVDL